jgi:hypothetical protein
MKKLFRITQCWSFSMLIFYIPFCFVSWSFNPSTWNWFLRLLFAVIGVSIWKISHDIVYQSSN